MEFQIVRLLPIFLLFSFFSFAFLVPERISTRGNPKAFDEISFLSRGETAGFPIEPLNRAIYADGFMGATNWPVVEAKIISLAFFRHGTPVI